MHLPISLALLIRLVWVVIAYSTQEETEEVKNQIPLVRVFSCLMLLAFCFIWLILRCCPYINKRVSLLVMVYLFWECTFANLSMRDMMPESLIETDKSADINKIIWAWFFYHCFDYNSVPVRTCVAMPIALIAYWFMVNAES